MNRRVSKLLKKLANEKGGKLGDNKALYKLLKKNYKRTNKYGVIVKS